MTVLVTGGEGFIGQNLLKFFDSKNISWLSTTRVAPYQNYLYLDLSNFETIESLDLTGVQTVVHLAGLAHTPRATESKFLAINYEGTKALVRRAKEFGVKHFIFISSIGVNGLGKKVSYRFDDKPEPQESYAHSKLIAELAIKELCNDGGMGYTIIRPPLVFGKGARGSFGTLMKVAAKNYPLPLGLIRNKRSFVYIDNLISVIVQCILRPEKSFGQTFLVSDDYDLSTSELMRKLIVASGHSPRLLPVPVSVLLFISSFLRKKKVVERFTSNLTVDIEHTKKTLDWTPPVSFDDGVRRCFK